MTINLRDGWFAALVAFLVVFFVATLALFFWAGAALFMPARTQQRPGLRPAFQLNSMVPLAHGERWSMREAAGGGPCVNGAGWSGLVSAGLRDLCTESGSVAFSGPRRNSSAALGHSLKPGLSNTAKRGNRFSAGDKGWLGNPTYTGSTPVGHLHSTVHASSTWLELRAHPPVSVAGRDPVILIGEIKGDEAEEFYCRWRELWWNGERVSGRGEECPPFEERKGYERRWAYYMARVPGEHRAEWVLLTGKGGRRIASASATWSVR